MGGLSVGGLVGGGRVSRSGQRDWGGGGHCWDLGGFGGIRGACRRGEGWGSLSPPTP